MAYKGLQSLARPYSFNRSIVAKKDFFYQANMATIAAHRVPRVENEPNVGIRTAVHSLVTITYH